MMSRLALFLILMTSLFMWSCGKENINVIGKKSPKTGVSYDEAPANYSDPFRSDLKEFVEQETAPGLVFIEGGTFLMGGGEKDIAYEMDNREVQVTVASFYMDETEVANVDYREFLFFIQVDSGPAKYESLHPDTTVWMRDLAYNDPYVHYYFQHPGFYMYPVVGVTWHMANEYCKWRTRVVNTTLLTNDPEAVEWPAYRLPTEAEWEYASRGGLEQENYPWIGKSLRDIKGRFMANFKRGRGDYAGRSNSGGSNLIEGLNDAYMIPAPVKAFYPNDFGLYNMAGNVAEWTMDTYRKVAYEDNEDLNPYRRQGKIVYNMDVKQLQADDKYNYAMPNTPTSLLFNPNGKSKNPGLPNSAADQAKVYRGGSWSDIAYPHPVGARRFYWADSSSNTIGFRSAMIRVGSPF